MWYVIEGYDGAQVLERRMAAREQHLQRLVALRDAGRLLLAGPCPAIDAEDPGPAGFSGSVVIAEFASLEDARAWAEADPYVAAGVYVRVEVRPFRQCALGGTGRDGRRSCLGRGTDAPGSSGGSVRQKASGSGTGLRGCCVGALAGSGATVGRAPRPAGCPQCPGLRLGGASS